MIARPYGDSGGQASEFSKTLGLSIGAQRRAVGELRLLQASQRRPEFRLRRYHKTRSTPRAKPMDDLKQVWQVQGTCTSRARQGAKVTGPAERGADDGRSTGLQPVAKGHPSGRDICQKGLGRPEKCTRNSSSGAPRIPQQGTHCGRPLTFKPTARPTVLVRGAFDTGFSVEKIRASESVGGSLIGQDSRRSNTVVENGCTHHAQIRSSRKKAPGNQKLLGAPRDVPMTRVLFGSLGGNLASLATAILKLRIADQGSSMNVGGRIS